MYLATSHLDTPCLFSYHLCCSIDSTYVHVRTPGNRTARGTARPRGPNHGPPFFLHPCIHIDGTYIGGVLFDVLQWHDFDLCGVNLDYRLFRRKAFTSMVILELIWMCEYAIFMTNPSDYKSSSYSLPRAPLVAISGCSYYNVIKPY